MVFTKAARSVGKFESSFKFGRIDLAVFTKAKRLVMVIGRFDQSNAVGGILG
jgi:hypothetical protein